MSDAMEQVEEWADEIYAARGKETTWSISEIRCPEEGCPPVETIFTDLMVKRPRPGNGVYKVFKPMVEVTREDVERALAEDTSGTGGGHEVGHGGDHGGHSADSGHIASEAREGEHFGDCCDSGHGEHGHNHSGHGHGQDGSAAEDGSTHGEVLSQ
mmetsp:Transcript_50442/g.135335  ORF Transcript_50442/g.135335 Transcript_50442/m.135335 type:complete len:156 (+) Transcript_50442:52-519(+)